MARVVGPYRIEKHLGRGGLGDAYRAFDERLGRHVALKVLPAALAPEREQVFADAFLAAGLEHPGIARLLEMGEHEGQPYLAFEFVEGHSLAARLARGPLPVVEAVTIAVALSDALAEAHARGLSHLDVKPSNVMLTPRGRPKLLDLGLAGWTRSSLERARVAADPAGAVADTFGTLEYVSPEQALGEAGDARSDIFSLGVLIHEMVTGRRPFTGSTPMAVLLDILQSAPVAPSRLNAAVPAALDAIVARCLAKPLDRRYQQAVHVGDALRGIASTPLPDVAPAPPRERVRVLVRRGTVRRAALLTAVTLAAAAAGACLFSADVRAALGRLL